VALSSSTSLSSISHAFADMARLGRDIAMVPCGNALRYAKQPGWRGTPIKRNNIKSEASNRRSQLMQTAGAHTGQNWMK
jgi:hypothetical protein